MPVTLSLNKQDAIDPASTLSGAGLTSGDVVWIRRDDFRGRSSVRSGTTSPGLDHRVAVSLAETMEDDEQQAHPAEASRGVQASDRGKESNFISTAGQLAASLGPLDSVVVGKILKASLVTSAPLRPRLGTVALVVLDHLRLIAQSPRFLAVSCISPTLPLIARAGARCGWS